MWCETTFKEKPSEADDGSFKDQDLKKRCHLEERANTGHILEYVLETWEKMERSQEKESPWQKLFGWGDHDRESAKNIEY